MPTSLKQSLFQLVFAPVLMALTIGLVPSDCLLGQEPAAAPTDSQAVYITDNRTDGRLDLAQLVERLKTADVIFLGEKHDNDAGHQFQLEVIQTLHAAGCDLAIGMEQFERDVQGAVDDYLAGKLSEEDFLAASRPWKNYPEHYRAIVELTLEKRKGSVADYAAIVLRHVGTVDKEVGDRAKALFTDSLTPILVGSTTPTAKAIDSVPF